MRHERTWRNVAGKICWFYHQVVYLSHSIETSFSISLNSGSPVTREALRCLASAAAKESANDIRFFVFKRAASCASSQWTSTNSIPTCLSSAMTLSASDGELRRALMYQTSDALITDISKGILCS